MADICKITLQNQTYDIKDVSARNGTINVLTFNTLADFKSATNLVDGSVVHTLGTTTYDDDKGYYYKVRTKGISEVPDDVYLIALTDTTLIGERVDDTFEIKGGTFSNKVAPTAMAFNKAFVTVKDSYTDSNPQMALISERTPSDDNRYDHNPYGLYVESTAKGNGNTTSPAQGTQIAILGNAVADGSLISNKSDYLGSTIGVAGFASSDVSGGSTVICGIWSYASTPELSQAQYNAIADKTSTFGMEINIDVLQPNNLQMDYVQDGAVVGLFINNYTQPNASTRQIYDFGIAMNGSPMDGDYTKQGVENYNGYHIGILIDKVDEYGIKFGQFFKEGATCIKIPSSWSFENDHPNITGLALGDSKINMGEFLGSTFNNGDIWRNGDTLHYRTNGVNHHFVMSEMPIGRPLCLGQETTGQYPNNSLWCYQNVLYFKDNSGTVHSIAFNA